VGGPEQVAFMAEQIPCETEGWDPDPMRSLAPGRVPKFLG
jgi:hypothetical protein